MQIAARAFDEPMVYRIAQAFCAATGFADKRPPIKLREKVATTA
jgi:Asp-tRNA(Asn)/Glu-tRNA(Gln) amidotransferase A subunit family amidase